MFGAKFLSTLSSVDIGLDEEATEEKDQEGEVSSDGRSAADCAAHKGSERKIWGMVSKAGAGVGRADNDRQFLYLNGRPVDLPKVNEGESRQISAGSNHRPTA